MLAEIIRDVKVVSHLFDMYGSDPNTIPPDVRDEGKSLAETIVKRAATMVIGYNEPLFHSLSGELVIKMLMHLRMDKAKELNAAGLMFNHYYDDGYISGSVYDRTTGLQFIYPLTCSSQSEEIRNLRWMLEPNEGTVN